MEKLTPTHIAQGNGKILAGTLTLCAFALLAGEALAFTAPAAGSFAFDVYDVAVNDILKGPIGFVGGVGCMVAAAVMAVRQMMLPAVGTVLGGAAMLKADSFVTTLGALVI